MLKNELESYLDDISHLTDATVRSHKATLKAFLKDCQIRGVTTEDLNPQLVAEHLADLVTEQNITSCTVYGKISVLANFTAYVQNANPAILSVKIRSQLSEILKTSSDNSPALTPSIELDEDSLKAIETYVQRMRMSAYGTREHVVTEISAVTGCRVKALRQINLGDVNLETGEIDLSLAKTHAVGKSGSKVTWEVTLPEETVRALTTYIDHERIPTENDDSETPLLTTHNGRVSVATLSRSIRESMCEVLNSDDTVGEGATDDTVGEGATDDTVGEGATDDTRANSVNHRHLSPRYLRQYYLSRETKE